MAYWAHVSGFGFGVVTALGVRWTGLEERIFTPALDAELTVLDNSGVDRALELRAEGNLEQAWTVLAEEVRRNPGNSDAVLCLWEWAKETDRCDEVAPAMARFLRELIQRGEGKEAYSLWRDVRKTTSQVALPLGLELRLAEGLAQAGLGKEAREVAEDAAHRANAQTPVGTLVRLSRLAASSGAARVAALALGRPDLSPDLSAEMEVVTSHVSRGRAEFLGAPSGVPIGGCAETRGRPAGR